MGNESISIVDKRREDHGSVTGSATFAYVGCFTTKERNARGKGISVYRIDPQTGAWSLVQVQDTLPNPGFLALDSTQRFLYSAHGLATVGIHSEHGGDTEISAYAIDPKTGKLKLLNTQHTHGDNSRVVTIDPSNRYVVAGSGTGLVSFLIKEDGSLAPRGDAVAQFAEPGTFREEEKGPHPHDTVFDPSGRFVLAPDKGLDRIHIYGFDAANGKFIVNGCPFVKSRYGAAPRHMAFHRTQPWAYVVNERDSTVASYRWDAERGELEPFQVLPTTPATFTAANKGSEIAVAPSGNFVYASNRGHDSIVVFAIDNANGMLSPVAWEPSQGKTPRFFTFDASGRLLYAANEDSDSIVFFDVDEKTGKLTATGQIVETESPSCIVFTRH